MNLLIEGTDCTGKSSIVRILEQHGYKTVKCNAPKNYEEGKREYEQIVERLNREDKLVYDRSLLGECVYAPVFRGYYPYYMRELERKINANNVLVLVEAAELIVKKRFDGKFIALEQIPELLKTFKEEYNKSHYTHKLVVDTSYESPERCAKRVLDFVAALAPEQKKLTE